MRARQLTETNVPQKKINLLTIMAKSVFKTSVQNIVFTIKAKLVFKTSIQKIVDLKPVLHLG